MDIFESLENLNVSEECFDEIMGIVEDIVSTAEKSGNQDLVNRAETAKEAGRRATEKKELERIQKNKTRKDIHPSVIKSAEKRDEAVDGLDHNGDSFSDDKGKAHAIARARGESRENKRTIGLDKTFSKKYPTYSTDYGETEVGGGDPSSTSLVRSTKDRDNYYYGNPNVKAEDNIRNSKGTSDKKSKWEEPTGLHDYQHNKKLATKALRGHNKKGSLKGDTKAEFVKKYKEDFPGAYEKGKAHAQYKRAKHFGDVDDRALPVTTSPKALYRLGKAIENRKNKNK